LRYKPNSDSTCNLYVPLNNTATLIPAKFAVLIYDGHIERIYVVRPHYIEQMTPVKSG